MPLLFLPSDVSFNTGKALSSSAEETVLRVRPTFSPPNPHSLRVNASRPTRQLFRTRASDMRPRIGPIVNRGRSTVAVAQSFRATVRWHANVTVEVAVVMIMILMAAQRHFHIFSHEASVGGAWH